MDVYLYHPDVYEQLYNCTGYNVDAVPIERRQHIFLGILFIALGVICEVLYVPCMIAIRKHMDSTCYQLMFYIAVADMLCLTMNAIVTGFLGIIGAVFCTMPNFIYIFGAFGLSLWCCETVMEMTLAFNRCVELSSAHWARLLFHGKRIFLWMLFPTFYGLYFFWYTQPLIFSGIFFSWFFNPHVGYVDDFGKTYHNDFHTFHNYIVITVLTGTYATFGIILYVKSREVHTASSKCVNAREQTSRKAQNMIFLQVILISLINAVAASIYVYMQFARISEFLIVIGQLTWVLAHGIPPIIYLALNKTVRRDVYLMMMKPLSKVFYCCVKAPVDPSITNLYNTITVRRTVQVKPAMSNMHLAKVSGDTMKY